MSNGLVEIRMVQQVSGTRGDGQEWPSPGGTLTVSAKEAAELCHTDPNSSVPIAVPVVEARKVETTDAPEDPQVEVRAEPEPEPEPEPKQAAPVLPPRPSTAVPDASPEPEPPKRGPGRPPKNG